MDDHATVAQVFVERDLSNAQALGNFIDAQLLLSIERLGHDGCTLRFFR